MERRVDGGRGGVRASGQNVGVDRSGRAGGRVGATTIIKVRNVYARLAYASVYARLLAYAQRARGNSTGDDVRNERQRDERTPTSQARTSRNQLIHP